MRKTIEFSFFGHFLFNTINLIKQPIFINVTHCTESENEEDNDNDNEDNEEDNTVFFVWPFLVPYNGPNQAN